MIKERNGRGKGVQRYPYVFLIAFNVTKRKLLRTIVHFCLASARFQEKSFS